MRRRRGLGLSSCLLAGCTSVTGSPQAGDDLEQTDKLGNEHAVTLQFADASPGLVVSCGDCPGILRDDRFRPGDFPQLALPLGTQVTLELLAPGFVSQTRKVKLDSERVVIPAKLDPL